MSLLFASLLFDDIIKPFFNLFAEIQSAEIENRLAVLHGFPQSACPECSHQMGPQPTRACEETRKATIYAKYPCQAERTATHPQEHRQGLKL